MHGGWSSPPAWITLVLLGACLASCKAADGTLAQAVRLISDGTGGGAARIASLPLVGSALRVGAATEAAAPARRPPRTRPASRRFGTGAERAPRFVTDVTGGGERPSTAGAVSVASHGAVGDCATDDTRAFRSAASAARTSRKPLLVPAPRGSCYRITGTIQAYGSVIGVDYPLVAMSGATGDGGHAIFVFDQVDGAWITGLRLDGGWDGSTVHGAASDPKQYSHGLSLLGVSNVTVSDNLVANTVGDSVYLGSGLRSGAPVPNRNVRIDGNTFKHPFRCVVAFINAQRVVVTNNVSVRNGLVWHAMPQGYDFEPNDASREAVRDVEIAYNDMTIDTSVADENNYATGASRSASSGGDWYLHDNVGRFGDRFWKNNSRASATLSNNVSTR